VYDLILSTVAVRTTVMQLVLTSHRSSGDPCVKNMRLRFVIVTFFTVDQASWMVTARQQGCMRLLSATP
jgi:hypothetical protein